MILFSLGLIIGLLIRDIKCHTLHAIEKYKKSQENKEDAQFFEPKSMKDKFNEATSFDDLLE